MSKRLTHKYHGGYDTLGEPLIASYSLELETAQGRINARCKLGKLEDILYDSDGTEIISLDQLKDLVQATCENRIDIHPVIPEATIYEIGFVACKKCPFAAEQTFYDGYIDIYGEPYADNCIEKCPEEIRETKYKKDYLRYIGEDFFLTRKEAEAELDKRNKDDK